MMLRTTISRIKKVCSVAFVPRILRGEQRSAPGKFETFSYAVIRKAPKRSKSTDEGEHTRNRRRDDSHDVLASKKEETQLEDRGKNEEGTKLCNNASRESIQSLLSHTVPIKETQCEKCQRIIDQAFGKEEYEEPMMGEQYFSKTVNIEETRREINESQMAKLVRDKNMDITIPDDRAQFGVFKMSREIDKGDRLDDQYSIEKSMLRVSSKKDPNHEDLIRPTLNIQLTSAKEPDLVKNIENVQGVVDDSSLINTMAKEESDNYIHNQENKQLLDLQEALKPLPEEEAEKIEMVKDEHRNLTDLENKIDFHDKLRNMYAENEDKLKRMIDCYLPNCRNEKILNSTTATEDEEQLTQKIEHIEETPLVEAGKPSIEGFNVTPRVLGNLEHSCGCFAKGADKSRTDVPVNFDEVAKRCLDSPVGKIDEILLNEMERLGIPIDCNSRNPSRSPVIEDDLMQMDETQQVINSMEQPIELEEPEPSETYSLFASETMYPSRHMEEKLLPEVSEQSDQMGLKAAEDVVEPDDEFVLHPLQGRIDPYDRKPLSFEGIETEEVEGLDPNTNFSYYFIPQTRLARGSIEIENTSPLENPIMQEMHNNEIKEKALNDAILKGKTYEGIEKASHLQPNEITIEENVETTRDPNIEQITRNLIAELTALRGASEHKQQQNNANELRYPTPEPVDKLPEKNSNQTLEPPVNTSPNIVYYDNNYKSNYKYMHRDMKAYYESNNNTPNNTWNNQMQVRPDYYTQKPYAKGNEKTPSYYQPMINWNQPTQSKADDKYLRAYPKGMEKTNEYCAYHQQIYQGNKYGHNMYEPDKNSYYAHNMYTWGHQPTSSKDRNKNMQSNYYDAPYSQQRQSTVNRDPVETPKEESESRYTEVTYMDKPPERPYNYRTVEAKARLHPSVNKTSRSEEAWEKGNPIKMSEVKPKETSDLPDEFMNQRLDPYYVLTCNETCPISPKPNMSSSCDSPRVTKTTEAIYGSDIKGVDPEPDRHQTSRMQEHMHLSRPANLNVNPHNVSNAQDNVNTEHITRVQPNTNKQDIPQIKPTTFSEALNSLPKLSDDVSLSELLRRVRERSRIIECRNELKALGLEVEPAQGKCNRKAPRCHPTAPRSPPNNPVPVPGLGLPQLKPRPPICKPRKKPHTRKYSVCEMDLSPSIQFGPAINVQAAEICTEMVCEINDTGTAGISISRSKADLTDEVIDRLHSLGKMLGEVLRPGRSKSQILDVGSLVRNRRSKTVLAREYEPWSPIPSYPIQKKEPKNSRCKPGCPVFPPPRSCQAPDPPAEQLKPCQGFPKRSFSMMDCFAVSLGKNKVYDLGEF